MKAGMREMRNEGGPTQSQTIGNPKTKNNAWLTQAGHALEKGKTKTPRVFNKTWGGREGLIFLNTLVVSGFWVFSKVLLALLSHA